MNQNCNQKLKNKKIQLKTTIMILFNGFINFILRLPEITVLIYIIFRHYFPNDNTIGFICKTLLICPTLIDISNLFFILTFTMTYFNFYIFNKKFRHCVSILAQKRPSIK